MASYTSRLIRSSFTDRCCFDQQGLQFGNPGPNAPTPESINLQRKKLHETRKLQRALKQEYARNEAIISQLRSVLSGAQSAATKQPTGEGEKSETEGSSATTRETSLPDLSFLTRDPAAKQLRVGNGTNPLTTNTTFILSQLPALRAMLEQLRPKLATLPKSADEMELDAKKEERRQYIESRIRLHLERAGELAMGEGNTVVAGRRIRGSEAQALESVTGMLMDDQKS